MNDIEALAAREVPLGGPRAMRVRRTLPQRDRSLIGAWCFCDHYGPSTTPMDVAPHPHIGLQTVSWLFSGSIEHRDSLGSVAHVEPGTMSLMTGGHGISHSEVSTGGPLHGVQLWIALPDAVRSTTPAFALHRPDPVDVAGARARVFLGSLGAAHSPVATATPLLGAQLDIDAPTTVPLDPTFEHGVLVDEGPVDVDGTTIAAHDLAYLPPGRRGMRVTGPGRVVLLGGPPFGEPILMWWNFVAREHAEIVDARDRWQARDPRFGRVEGYEGARPWLPAPELPSGVLRSR